MTPAQWRRVNDLFDEAVEQDPGSWEALIAQERTADAAVAKELEDLLKAHRQSTGFLAKPVADLSPRTLLSRMNRLMAPPPAMKPGERIEGFEIVRQIGEGGFAKVYLARELSLGRHVALKVSSDIGREASTMAGLEHDHIVQVYSETVVQDAGLQLICMQLVQGATLAALISRLGDVAPLARSGERLLALLDAATAGDGGAGETLLDVRAMRDREALTRLDFASACLWLGERMAEALAFAHARGILHLDVKPANILVNRYGRPMLSDFNVSVRSTEVDGRGPAVIGGTLSYMAPEQHKAFTGPTTAERVTAALTREAVTLATPIDGRADVYALGMVLTELMTCRKVEKTVDEATGTTILHGTEGLPEEIASVLHRAVRTKPEERFKGAAAFAAALKNCRSVAAIRTAVTIDNPLYRLTRRNPVLMLVLLAVVPQLLGSAVNITYNAVRIVAELNDAQRAAFKDLVVAYNLVFYPLGTWLVWRQIAFLVRSLRHRRDRYMPDPDSMATLRRRVLQTPYVLVLATTVGWLPGAILFPALIDYAAGPIPAATYWHFVISFVSSWLIALTYSFLLLESVVLQVIYPRFWTGCCEIKRASRHELKKVNGRLKLFQILAGIIPLAGAVMIVGAGPEIIDPQRYYVFQVLVVSLIALGMVGFVFAMKTTENVKRTVGAFLDAT